MDVVPKISIVTPSYNQQAFIKAALQSVKDQNYPLMEHLVCDGGSVDGTVEILQALSGKPGWKHLHWISESDEGQSDALNKGFRMATGELVGWLNSDDRYRPGCFNAVISAADKYPEIDVLYGDYTWIDQNDKQLQIRREIEFNPFVLAYHRVLYIPTTSTFFRRRIFDDGNWIDTRYHYAMDYEFFMRLMKNGYEFQHIPHLLADFRWHCASKSDSQRVKHLQEHHSIARMYSPILRNLPPGLLRSIVEAGSRLLAAGIRYSEKFLRGYYFEQYRCSD